MPIACFDPTLRNSEKRYFNRVGENSVQFCTNPCPPFIAIMTKQGSSMSQWFQ